MTEQQYYAADIYLLKQKVGSLTCLPGPDLHVFTFDDDYINDSNRPTLSLHFKSQIGGLITKPLTSRKKLPSFFSNLLPEGHLRDYLAKANGVHAQREFFLLRALGKDLPGAVIANSSKDSQFDPGLSSSELDKSNNTNLRFSLAGVQMKFSALAESKADLTIPVKGIGGDWIVKLPSLIYPNIPENEFSMLRLARAAGITVPAIKLLPTDQIENLPDIVSSTDLQSLAIRRFDRHRSGGRIHIEDFAQVLGVYPRNKYDGYSYNNIASILWIEAKEEDVIEFLRRLVFTIGIGNADMHLKNWSLIYRDGRKPSLAPAYDFVSTIAYLNDPNLGLTLGKTKDMYKVDIDDFLYLADTAKLPAGLVVKTVKESIDSFRSAWSDTASELPFPDEMRRKIDQHILKLPLFRPDNIAIRKSKSVRRLPDI